MLKQYYYLTKPGIIYSNLLTATGGFLLASKWHIKLSLLVGTLLGTALVIASACVFNNCIDRNIDNLMQRTRNRALVKGAIPLKSALIYGSLLLIAGLLIIKLYVNSLVLAIGVIAFIDYVVLYGLSKRRSSLGTLIGSISGAAAVVAGFCAVTDRFNLGALLLFLILVFWQMPHFYAIALNRIKDYKMANIPVLPIVRGFEHTKKQILLYIVGFIIANIALAIFGYAGYIYAIIMSVVGIYWLWLGSKGSKDDAGWPKKMFLSSLLVILSLAVMLSIGSIVP